MVNAWLAQVGSDPRERARDIARAHARFLSTGAATQVREVVARSWVRSADARVDPDTDPPVTLADGDLAEYRNAHPLARIMPVLRDLIADTAEDGHHLWAVTDAGGRLLWVEGHRAARDLAARMNFVEGAQWDEAHAGTNAPGTALALDHEVQIFAAEHFRHTVQAWTCSAAPIHDPGTGRILGVLDVTGGDAVANPHSLALVKAAARVAEANLDGLRPTAVAARLEVLGRPEGVLLIDGHVTQLHRRHAELMVLLAAHPEGLTGQQLAAAMYADGTADATLRVELTRLRRLVGPLLRSRPYRLAAAVDADFADVSAALLRGEVEAAVRGYPGPLLPTSQAPGVVEHRDWLETRLRASVLGCRDPRTLYRFASAAGFCDLAVWERLQRTAPPGTPQHAAAVVRVRALRAEYGLGATLM